MNFLGIGGFEIIVVAGLAFFLLGPKKMIETSRSAGKILRDLRSERDKFMNMVMQEFDGDAKESAAGRSGSADGKSPDSDGAVSPAAVGPESTGSPDGAVSRPRGRTQDVAVRTGAGMGATSDDAEEPALPTGGS